MYGPAPQAKMDSADANNLAWSFGNGGEQNSLAFFDGTYQPCWHRPGFGYGPAINPSQQYVPEQGQIAGQFSSPSFTPVREAVPLCVSCKAEKDALRISQTDSRLEKIETSLARVAAAVDKVVAILDGSGEDDVAGAIESIKNGMDRFFTHFADQFPQEKEGSSEAPQEESII